MTRRGLRPEETRGWWSCAGLSCSSSLLALRPRPLVLCRCHSSLLLRLAAGGRPMPASWSSEHGRRPCTLLSLSALCPGAPPAPTSGFSYFLRGDTLPPLSAFLACHLSPSLQALGTFPLAAPHHLRLSGVRQASDSGSPLRGLLALPSAACPWLMERNSSCSPL